MRLTILKATCTHVRTPSKGSRKFVFSVVVSICCLLLVVQFVQSKYSASQTANVSNWPSPGFDDHNSDFDPQTVINSQNVKQLQLSWV
ncbi:MAG: hypothetical protein ACHQ1H_11260, partial [Nitrososphaerales archaeon]